MMEEEKEVKEKLERQEKRERWRSLVAHVQTSTSAVADRFRYMGEWARKAIQGASGLRSGSLVTGVANSGLISWMSGMGSSTNTVTILHYNDVYNVESSQKEPVGGAARFCSALKTYSHLDPLILFSGDIFAPSILSTFTKGEQMVPVLNHCGTHCAVYGNHDFDFGLDQLMELKNQTTFPWLMSNVADNESGGQLGEGKVSYIVSWQGKKIGLLGLVEKEWLDTLSTINPNEVTFTDYVEAGRTLGRELKNEGCDYVIALTHMRTPNDVRLAENVEEIDLILGGHDHVYEMKQVNGKYIMKSGTDFRQFSRITLTFNHTKVQVEVEAIDVTSKFPEDEKLKQELEKYADVIQGKMDEVLGTFLTDLDGRFSSVRTKETNLGNFVCDVMLAATNTDLALLNSGTLRLDQIHPAGNFTLRDLMSILPMLDTLIVLQISGRDIIQALENGVSQYPKLEGRFPQVSGVSFAFDPNKPPGNRVEPQFVKIGDEYLQLDHQYKLTTKAYLQQGKDGYDVFKECKVLSDEEMSPQLSTAIQNHFHSIKMRQGHTRRNSVHRQSLVTLSRRHSVVKQLNTQEDPGPQAPLRSSNLLCRRNTIDSSHNLLVANSLSSKPKLKKHPSLENIESRTCLLNPRVEGRIVVLTEEVYQELLQERKATFATDTIMEVEEPASPITKSISS